MVKLNIEHAYPGRWFLQKCSISQARVRFLHAIQVAKSGLSEHAKPEKWLWLVNGCDFCHVQVGKVAKTWVRVRFVHFLGGGLWADSFWTPLDGFLGPFGGLTNSRCPIEPATCNLQPCNLQPATCNLATCNLQPATLQHGLQALATGCRLWLQAAGSGCKLQAVAAGSRLLALCPVPHARPVQ